jgi:hypothetical protein
MSCPDQPRWLLLIHQIPSKPGYLRVKAWRRLQKLGSVAIKSSVYVMPRNDQAYEDLVWVAREITDGGGEASICEASFVEGLDDRQIEMLFRAAREADYTKIVKECRVLGEAAVASEEGDRELTMEAVTGLRRRFEEILAIDFFEAPGRLAAMGAIADVEQRARRGKEADAGVSVDEALDRSEYRGRTWVTRERLFVDRIASAWLIRRFIDPDATFKFVPGKGFRPGSGELRFDMYDAEFSHVGNCCTFEVMLHRFGLGDPALAAIAEVVHDIDLKDSKFGREEVVGVAVLLTGLVNRARDDEERLARGSAVFEDLYACFAAASGTKPEGDRND